MQQRTRGGCAARCRFRSRGSSIARVACLHASLRASNVFTSCPFIADRSSSGGVTHADRRGRRSRAKPASRPVTERISLWESVGYSMEEQSWAEHTTMVQSASSREGLRMQSKQLPHSLTRQQLRTGCDSSSRSRAGPNSVSARHRSGAGDKEGMISLHPRHDRRHSPVLRLSRLRAGDYPCIESV